MFRFGYNFGIFEIFSHLVPGILFLSSIYLCIWPNPSNELLNSHLKLVSSFSFSFILLLIAYSSGFILDSIGLFVFNNVIYPLTHQKPEKLFKERHFYPSEINYTNQEDKKKYTYSFQLKKILEEKYGTALSFWLLYKQCESVVRAKYPQNSQTSERFNAFSIMSRSVGLALILLAIVLFINMILGRFDFSFKIVLLIIFILISAFVLIRRAIILAYWAIREIFNTFYFMNTIESK